MKPICSNILAILFPLILISAHLVGQDTGQIRGKVFDKSTGKPIPFANVYFNNTSIGVTADSSGNYMLRNVPTHYTDLVYSSVGYESQLVKVSFAKAKIITFDARLRASTQLLGAVTVKAKRDRRWRENYDRFLREFLGEGPNAKQCEIKNPGALNFTLSGAGDLKATAREPIHVVNQSLGYEILIDLQSFQSSQTSYSTSFHSRFLNLAPKDARETFRWQANRIRSYKGSMRHFLTSLINNQLQREGYRIYYPAQARIGNGAVVPQFPDRFVPPDALVPKMAHDPNLTGYFQLLQKGNYEIQYLNRFIPFSERVYKEFPHPVSWLEVPDSYLVCPPTGILKSNSNYVLSGYMNEYRIADLLPDDYNPEKEEANIYLVRSGSFRTLKGMVTDASSGKPLAGAHVFLNNTLIKTDANYQGKFELKKVPLGVYELVAAFGGYPTHSQHVVVKEDTATEIQVGLVNRVKALWPDTVPRETKQKKFKRNFLRWAPFSLTIRNPYVIEMKREGRKAYMRINGSLEIDDSETGYRMHCYLNDVELNRRRTSNTVNAYVSFDTLTAKTLKQRDKWLANRYELYDGSVQHFMRSLVEGRAEGIGFKMTTEPAGNRGINIFKKKPRNIIMCDSLLVKGTESGLFKIKSAQPFLVKYKKQNYTRMAADTSFRISEFGIVSSESELKMKGPMASRAILPTLPIDYDPFNGIISNQHVLVFAQNSQMKSIQNLLEKTYLHTDKNYYYPGEKIWYKAYVQIGRQELKDSLSKVLHVELINEEKRVVRNEILKIENGVAWGDLALPDTLKTGNYFLRAYTQWSLNFGDDYIFQTAIPVIATSQNLAPSESLAKATTSNRLSVLIQPDRPSYAPRQRITLTVKVARDHQPENANLSVSITDADKIFPGTWAKTIVEDSLKFSSAATYARISRPLEKDFTYNCSIQPESNARPTSVLIWPLKQDHGVFAKPNKDLHFQFTVDFSDTSSFIFRAISNKGIFAGHVTVEKPVIPTIHLPNPPRLSFAAYEAKDLIRYSYNPAEKSTLLEEVVVRAKKTSDLNKKIYNPSIPSTPSRVFELKDLAPIVESAQDPLSFWQLIADKIPGANPHPDYLLLIRRESAQFTVNYMPYSADQMMVLSPTEIERVEFYPPPFTSQVFVYLKSGPDQFKTPIEFDRFTLSGFASPSTFYMRDYSKENPDNELPDRRTTIYWQPNVITGAAGATLTFYSADLPAKYRIVVQGLTDEGQPVYGEQIIEVK